MPPRISVITPSFNQGEFVEDTIRSVLEQHYPDLEYIVVDGGSTDGTLEILRRYSNRLSFWVSEPDAGQTEAINKGLAKTTGEVIGYLNSDDVYTPGALKAVGEYFSGHPECRWLCGEGVEFGMSAGPGRPVPRWIPEDAAQAAFFNYRMVQPANFWRRQLFARYGGFDPRHPFCFDHEFYVRLLVGGERCHALDAPIAAFRLHPASKTVSLTEQFDPDVWGIRDRYLADLPPAAILRERARRAWREAGFRLAAADVEWRAGARPAALRLGIEALSKSPPAVAFFLIRRLRRIIGWTRGSD